MAYSDEHAGMEAMIADGLEAKWAFVRGKAKEYLHGGASDGRGDGEQDMVPIEVVQLEIEVASEVDESGSEDEER